MYVVHEKDEPGARMEAPYARVVKHLIAPWNAGSSKLWMGISVIDPNSQSNLHAHENQEEIFYCLSGQGIIKVDDVEVETSAGTCVFIPPGAAHQLINTQSDQLLRILSATAPPFSQDGWSVTHKAEGE